MVFNKYEGLPEHYSNSNVYMTVIRGLLSIGLDEQEIHEYEAGIVKKRQQQYSLCTDAAEQTYSKLISKWTFSLILNI